MKKLLPFRRLSVRQAGVLFTLAFVLTLCFPLLSKAQPEFSQAELQLLRERRTHPDLFKFQIGKENSPLNPQSVSNKSMLADGNLDPAFNASVTESSGYVDESVVQPDGKIIIAGSFQRANGTRVSDIARLNPDGTTDTGFNVGSGPNVPVRALALQPDGKILVGGNFTTFNGQTVRRIVRLNTNGSLDSSFSTTVNFNGQINTIVVLSDGKILVGGAFTLSSSKLVRLNPDGTVFDSVPGTGGTIYNLLVQPDGKIVVAGTSFDGLRRLNTDLTVDPTFNDGTGPSSTVLSMALQPDGKIILGGLFTSYNGNATDFIVRVNSDGSFDTAFDFLSDEALLNGEVEAVAVQPDGKILASYIYYTDNGYIGRVSRFNSNATPDATFTTGDLTQTYAANLTVLGDGKFFVGGAFSAYNNQTRLHFVKLNSDGSFDTGFNTAVSSTGIVYAMKKQADGKIIIAGDFDFVNGVRKIALARLNPDGTLDNSFGFPESGFYGDIYDLEIQPDGKILIAGLFTGSLNFPASNVARLNSNGSFDISLNDFANPTDRLALVAYAIKLQPDGKIIVGGSIADQNFSNNYGTKRLNTNGIIDTTYNPSPISLGHVRAILVQADGKIIIGGTYLWATSFPRSGVARLNPNGSLNEGFSVSEGLVYGLQQNADGQVYTGGTTLTRYSPEGVIDSTFNVGSGFNLNLRAIKLQPDGKILAGGFFTTYNGTAANKIIRINPNGAIDPTFSPANGSTGNVFAIELQADGKILAGGQFLDFNGTEKFSIARLQNAAVLRAAPFDFDGDNKTDLSIFRSSVGEWWYNRSSDATVRAAQFGASTDKPVPADFTGDGKTDIAFFRPASGEWFMLRSEDGSFLSFPFGANGDVPTVGDFDGDGKSDPTIYRPSTNEWFILKSTGGTAIFTFGTTGDKPVPADFDGDGKTDVAIFRPSDGSWWYVRSTDNQFRVFSFGVSTDKPVPGDWTGDGKADIAVFRPSTGEWYFQRSEDNSFYSVPFGALGDIPVPGDYDGDGKFDTAVFRPSGSTWYVNRSTAGLMIQQFGVSTDSPVPAVFQP